MRGLSRSVNNGSGANLLKKIQHSLAITNIQFVMHEIGKCFDQPILIPASIPLRPEEDRPLIIIDSMNLPTKARKMQTDFRSNEPRRASNEEFFHFF